MKNLIVSIIFLIICSHSIRAQVQKSNKQKAVEVLESIENGKMEPIAYINPNKYIQHNLMAGDGIQGFGELMKMKPPTGFKAKVVRAFQDGDFVYTHTIYDFFGPKVGFDIFRFENGLIVEHWDNLAAITAPNPSGRTQTDGTTQLTDTSLTEANRKAAKIFVEEGIIKGKMMKAMKYMNRKNYAQHSSGIADGMKGLMAAQKEAKKSGKALKYTKTHMILAEGNFVLVVSEGYIGETHSSFYDLFRFENGKILEHWDTIESIPPKEQWKNNNGKF